MPSRLLDDLKWIILQIRESNECAKKDLDFKKRECGNYQTDFGICRLYCGFPGVSMVTHYKNAKIQTVYLFITNVNL
jgi:hypothetical protein